MSGLREAHTGLRGREAEWAAGNTDGWVVPAQGALPDAEGIVQQVGSLLVLILVPGKQQK